MSAFITFGIINIVFYKLPHTFQIVIMFEFLKLVDNTGTVILEIQL